MRVSVGAGWHLTHLTDRVVRLEKPDVLYRRMTGRDGYVLVRIEPQETRDHALDRAIRLAKQNDADLGLRAAAQLAPSLPSLVRYRRKQKQMAAVFGIPGEEPSERVYRP